MEKFIDVVTEYNGSCQCGDCYCRIYSDGTIQYDGRMGWQCSERRLPTRGVDGKWAEPMRSYNSQLREEDYITAMNEM